MQFRPFFFLFLLPCIAVTAKSWQTVSVNSQRSGIARGVGDTDWVGGSKGGLLGSRYSRRGVPVR